MKRILVTLTLLVAMMMPCVTVSGYAHNAVAQTREEYLYDFLMNRLADFNPHVLILDDVGEVTIHLTSEDLGCTSMDFLHNRKVIDAQIRKLFVRNLFTEQECEELADADISIEIQVYLSDIDKTALITIARDNWFGDFSYEPIEDIDYMLDRYDKLKSPRLKCMDDLMMSDCVVVDPDESKLQCIAVESVRVPDPKPEPPVKPVKPVEEEIFKAPEQMPQFPGGSSALMAWLSKNINYPETALQNGVQGKVVVKFVVEKDGSVSDVVVVKGVDKDLDREAVRIVRKMPKWQPGKNNGKAVRCYWNLPVTFKIQEPIIKEDADTER